MLVELSGPVHLALRCHEYLITNAQSVGPLERGCQSTTINLETRNSRDERVKSARKRNGPGSREVHAPRSEQKFETRTAVGRRDREKRSTRRDRRSPVHEKTSRKHRRIGQSERAQIESAALGRFGSWLERIASDRDLLEHRCPTAIQILMELS